MSESSASKSTRPPDQQHSGAPMDFVIGGVPRSGTTILSKLLNGHEQVYSYSSETNIFRHMWLYGRYGPMPKTAEAEFRAYLERDMQIVFKDHFAPYAESLKRYQDILRKFNPKVPERPLLPLFGPKDIAQMHEQIVALLTSGLWGAPLFREASVLMGEWLRARSGRDIVGEKTPDNIISMPLITKAAPQSLFICTFRDPMPTIRSMINRSSGGGVQDAAFSADFLTSLGQYEAYARAIVRAKRNTDRVYLLPYEKLVEQPDYMVHGILTKLGLSAPPAVRQIARALVGQAPKRPDAHAGYARGEVRIAKLVLGEFASELASELGFEADLEVTEGRPYSDHDALDAELPARLIPISGELPATGLATLLPNRTQSFRFAGSATALLAGPADARSLILEFHCASGSVPDEGHAISVFVNNAEAGETKLDARGKTVAVDVALEDFAAAWVEKKTYAHVIRLKCEALDRAASPPPMIEVRVRSVS